MEKDTNVIFRINSTLKENVAKIAKDRGVTLSELITACLKFIDHKKMIPYNINSFLPPKYENDSKVTIALIKMYLNEIIEKQAKGHVKKVYLFGSYARGEQTDKSDVDLRFEVSDDFSLIEHSNIRLDLKNALKKDIDLITGDPNELDDFFLKNIMKDEICIYEQQR